MTYQWNPRVYDDAMKMAGLGLRAATIYAKNCVQEILSVPAPRVTLTDKTGAKYYRAGFKLSDKKRNMLPANNWDVTRSRVVQESTYRLPKGGIGPAKRERLAYQTAPAIKGEPPRKLLGNLRRNQTYEFLNPMKTFEANCILTTGRVGTNVKYARSLEFGKGDHAFLSRTFRERWKQIQQVLYDNAGSGAI